MAVLGVEFIRFSNQNGTHQDAPEYIVDCNLVDLPVQLRDFSPWPSTILSKLRLPPSVYHYCVYLIAIHTY